MAGTREERAKTRYEKKDKTKPEATEQKQLDGAAGEPLSGSDSPAEDAQGVERKAVMDRHIAELRDMRRQHAGEHRTILGRHDKEHAEMMARHMGGNDKPRMGDKGEGDKE